MASPSNQSTSNQSLATPPATDLYGEEGGGFLIVYVTLLLATTVCGNLGNLLVVGAITLDRRLRQAGNLFILNLALADLCVTGFVDPFSIVGVFVGHQWFLDHMVLCHVIGSVCLVSCVCSLWSIAAISVNRYILLCKPALYQRVYTWNRTAAMSVCLWLGASFLDLPNFLDWGDHTYDMKTMACSYDRLASYSYTVFFITMFVTVPLITVLFCNINIYIVVIRSKIRVAAHAQRDGGRRRGVSWGGGGRGGGVGGGGARGGSSGAEVVEAVEGAAAVTDESKPGTSHEDETQETHVTRETQEKHVTRETRATGETHVAEGCDPNLLQVPGTLPTATLDKIPRRGKKKDARANFISEVRLAKTLFLIFLMFCLCWAPYALLCLVDKRDRAVREAYAVSILLAHASSTINSILYALTNKAFRNGYKLCLARCGFKCFQSKSRGPTVTIVRRDNS